ncbi:MAG: hypothetical protein IVW57_07325 [Ktedonobacterales bacterium]|nr:hypothetical protein [Ktedonobacterales bacterium]
MSQRTRAHTTGAPRKPRKPRPAATPDAGATPDTDMGAELVVTERARESDGRPATPAPEVSAEELARLLRAVAGELERDPHLARRVAVAMRPSSEETAPAGATAPVAPPPTSEAAPLASGGHSFRPRLITGAAPGLGPGVPDPFALRARLGAAGLHAVLEELRLGTLRAMVREHGLDPTGRLTSQNDPAKLRALILAAAAERAR